MKVNARTEEFQQLELFGKYALFTNGRIDRPTVPKGWYCNDFRGSDDNPGELRYIEESVAVNHAGSILMPEKLELPPSGRLDVRDEFGFLDEGDMTLHEFCEVHDLPYPAEEEQYHIRPARPDEAGLFYAPAEANGLLNPQQPDAALPIKVNTRAGFQLAHPGDSIDLAFPTTNTRRGRVGRQIAHTVTPGNTQACFFIDLNTAPKPTGAARCITTRQDGGIGHHKGERSGVWVEETDNGKFGVPVQTRDGETHYGRVRRLTPRECWRLQGFTDEQFDLAAATGLSDARLYKMAGNAVSVPVIAALGRFIKKIHTAEQITQEVIPSRHP